MSSVAKKEKSRTLDQFYTNPEYAKTFYNVIDSVVDLKNADVLLEPSAGTGNFFKLFDSKKRIGLDIDPKYQEVIKKDFLDWDPPQGKSIYCIGNPPFGKNSNLAVKFFNRAAEFSDVIAFVLPKTFRKVSIVNRLNTNFHCIYDEDVPNLCFTYKNKPYDVWCCAQIWIKKTEKRQNIKILKFSEFTDFFEIVDPENADFAIQRVGGSAGVIKTSDFKKYSKQSHYFFKQNFPNVLEIFKKINFDLVKNNTAGNPSISPNELLSLWKEQAIKNGIIFTFGNNLFFEE